jgi:D-glycero-alpha-D-manno-heptose-7-phosphate kinase
MLTKHARYSSLPALWYTPRMARSAFASAPTRVDFAGGTLDIYPLYLFFNGARTLNAAINLDALARITRRKDARIVISSLDTGLTLESNGLDELPEDGPLALITRVLRHFRPAGGMDITTRLLTPHGSGLGSSSALFIAMAHAVLAYMDRPRDTERIIRISNHLEAQLMGMPAGLQDYYPPSYGGINSVNFMLEDTVCENLDPMGLFFPEVQEHLIVTYTNMSHHSGTTNWGKMRNFFDGVPRTVESFKNIKATAEKMYTAFKKQDIREIARLLEEEWDNRKKLTDGVTTPAIDKMMDAARAAGAWASKLCGAGGGGCMLTLAPPEVRPAVIAALQAAGCSYLDAQLTREGVRVEVREV